MSQTPNHLRRIPAADLEAFVARALGAAGLPGGDAQTVAHLMTEIDLRGVDGHGVMRLPGYLRRLHGGGLNPRPQIKVLKENEATALVDGDNAMGHLVMKRAAEIAIDKAAQRGIAWVGSRFSNHAGAAFPYAMMPLARDMIGLYVAVGSANHMPPWGGSESLLSTNPIAVAVPAHEEPPVILDMATTMASAGKVKTAARRGEKIPEGWMIDRQGRPITDPSRHGEGFLMPIGGYKGYGLALIFGLLAGTLNGAAFGKGVIDFNKDMESVTNTGQFILAIDIKAFADVEVFKRQVDGVVRQMHGSPSLPGADRVRVPGEHSHRVRAERAAQGIPLHPDLLGDLEKLAGELGIKRLPGSKISQ